MGHAIGPSEQMAEKGVELAAIASTSAELWFPFRRRMGLPHRQSVGEISWEQGAPCEHRLHGELGLAMPGKLMPPFS